MAPARASNPRNAHPSVGIAIFPTDGTDERRCCGNADLAMYFAKRRGPGQFAFFGRR